MRINQNIMAFNAFRNLTATNNDLGKSLEKLSSGFRINRAADDAAGLVVSEGLRAQVSGLRVAVRNAQDGTSVVQTAEGALTEVHSMLRRMRDLALQARNAGANDLNAREAAQAEIDELKDEIDRVAGTTKFGSVTLLDGSYGSSREIEGTAAAYTTTTIAAGNDTFRLRFTNSAGVNEDVTVTLNAGAYTTADSLAAEFSRAIDEAINAVDPSSVGSVAVTAEVQSDGTGVKFVISAADAFSIDDANGADAAEDGGDDENGLFTHLRIGVAAGNGGADFGSTTDTAASVVGTGGVFQVGANQGANERITVAIGNMDTSASGLNVAALDVTTEAGADSAITALDDAIEEVSTQRGKLGALQNRFEHTIANLSVTQENLAASESRIRDTDMALELVTFTRHQILQQAGTAMLAQANQVPQSVLSLLR